MYTHFNHNTVLHKRTPGGIDFNGRYLGRGKEREGKGRGKGRGKGKGEISLPKNDIGISLHFFRQFFIWFLIFDFMIPILNRNHPFYAVLLCAMVPKKHAI